MASNERTSEPVSWFKRTSAVVGLIGATIGVILGSWMIISQLQEARQIREKVKIHLFAGDRLATQQRYDQAIKEYEKVFEVDKNNIKVHLRIISTVRRHLTFKAFPPGDPGNDFALRPDYDSALFTNLFARVSDSEINAVLTRIYQLQALNPILQDDIELLLEEALILKTRGTRTKEAIKVLEKAHKLAPENPELLAELGLLLAVLSHKSPQRAGEGVTLIRRAIQNRPNEACYHFYLARSLATAYLCPHRGLEYSGADDAQACAEAIREYHRATDLATGDDIWSQRIRTRAQKSSMGIFHRYAMKEADILTPKLGMPLDERIKELEYLMSTGASRRSQMGLKDCPEFWLATLYHATGSIEKADHTIRKLLESDHDNWLGKDKHYWEDKYYVDKRLLYFELFVKILEAYGNDPKTLAKVKSLMKQKRQKTK